MASKICKTQQCPFGGRPQALSEFTLDVSRRDGLARICRTCNRLKLRNWYARNAEKKRAKSLEAKAAKKRKHVVSPWDINILTVVPTKPVNLTPAKSTTTHFWELIKREAEPQDTPNEQH